MKYMYEYWASGSGTNATINIIKNAQNNIYTESTNIF